MIASVFLDSLYHANVNVLISLTHFINLSVQYIVTEVSCSPTPPVGGMTLTLAPRAESAPTCTVQLNNRNNSSQVT